MSEQANRVAVYGTLKQGQCNHFVLEGQSFIGHSELSTITLYDLGPYPAAKPELSDGVVVEVYEVDDRTLSRLDQLEGFNAKSPGTGLYNRLQLDTPLGKAWVYIYNHDVNGCVAIHSGNWFASAGCG